LSSGPPARPWAELAQRQTARAEERLCDSEIQSAYEMFADRGRQILAAYGINESAGLTMDVQVRWQTPVGVRRRNRSSEC
jgi:hypothetical protein